MPADSPQRETWAEVITSYLRLRGLNQRKLSIEWGISTAVMSNWVSKGARPSILNVIKVHEKSALPLDRLLAAAGYISLEISNSQADPPWLRDALTGLSTAELAVVAETARGLHRLREETRGYEAAPQAPAPPKRARRKSPQGPNPE